jgi:predicted nucleic acid-binding protein
MRKVHPKGPAEVIALGARGVYTIALSAADHWPTLQSLLAKYANRPISFADACLIVSAEQYEEPRIATFDADFRVYKWARRQPFEIL